MAVIGFAGMSVAQDIYSSGFCTHTNGVKYSAVFKNSTKLYTNQITTSADYYGKSSDVDVYNGDVWWTDNHYYKESDNFKEVKLFKNHFEVSLNMGTGSHINDLQRSINGTFLFAMGSKTYQGSRTAWFWRNSDSSSDTDGTQLGTTYYTSEAFGAAEYNNYMYMCGYQYTNSSTYHGVIWNGSSVFHNFADGTKIYGMVYYNGYFWTVGSSLESGNYKLKVWQTDVSGGSTSVVYTLAESMSSGFVDERFSIFIDDAGDIYVNGMNDSSSEKVWKNGTELYENGYYLNSVVVNTNGIYYAGCSGANETGKIWKDGSLLYTPTDCNRVTNLFIAEPECTNSEVRGLPFTDGFERGNTSWPCWTKIDVDNSNGTKTSYWHRAGLRTWSNFTGNYCVAHDANSSSNQEGWLVTPRLFLQPLQSETKMTFKSWANSSVPLKVYVSTSSNPSTTSNFVEVWSENGSGNWQTKTVDLSAYQGRAVYIAFKYTGTSGSWGIDDVSVTESHTTCSPTDLPYSISFNTHGNFQCWTAYDVDMTPQNGSNIGSWLYNETDGYDGSPCVYHHYGPSGAPQTGWLFSRRIILPSGNYNYTMSFKSKTTSSGTGKRNTVWVAENESGAPQVSHFTTKVWEDQTYSSEWTTYNVDLTAYKGKTVTIGFKYEGTYAHNWFLDDFTITQSIAQYTITANSNNNAWGTVTGGGPYDPGATCVLHATANTGYVFNEWRKNGNIVSINPNYSFEVTESATITGIFGTASVTNYTITTQVTPAGAGTVTVAGGNIHEAGSTTTLTATANPGYTFAHWQDGNTDNPRTITVTGDATYTATFTHDTYTITTNVTPAGSGTVTGGGSNYHYGDEVTLTATPANSDYEFAGWQDGNSDNPRSITVTGDATYTATFNEVGVTMFNVTAGVSPANSGMVNGTGTYPAGTDILLEAIPEPGYTFSHWQDGITTNPRSVSVTGDMSFTAYFTQNSYIISVVASPTNGGTVSGGGSYHYGNYANLTATPATGYEFQGWSDGSSENPHPVMVTGNATYTATFSPTGSTYYNVSAYISPSGAGIVNGTGSFPAGTTITLTAVANSGYVFNRWNDGSTTNPRTVTVNSNMSFTAYFNSNQYTIAANASPASGGTVTGGGSYPYGASVTLTATPNTGYSFMQWSDGVTANPRSITVTGNATYTALFMAEGGETFTLTVTSGAPLLGQVTGSGVYPAGALVEIKAIPASYARFVKWNDGNTDNPRTVVVNSDLAFVAEFVQAQQYTITVQSNNAEWGQVNGGGTFNEGTQIEISAIANPGYVFTGWNDGNTNNPRTITVTGNATYTAQFAENTVTTYNVTLICNTAEGSVSGGGTFISGTTTTIQAFPKQGYIFTKWSDESTENPRTITVNENITLVAFFAVGIDENASANLRVYPNPAKESIFIDGIEANTQVEIFNSLGELVKVVSVSENQEISVRDLAAGLYMVHFGNATLRFVKEQ